MTYLDVYKIIFLITVRDFPQCAPNYANFKKIAVVSTIPWDSYLIRTRIWTYPPNAILGPTLFDIPAEEVFFFVIQTYTTSLLYLIFNKATFHPIYLSSERQTDNPPDSDTRPWRLQKHAGQAVLVLGLSAAWVMFDAGGTGTYMGLIVGWAFPFLLLLW